VTVRDVLCYVAGLGFLFLAKAKNVLMGYSTPKPFDIGQVERCVDYDLRVVDHWLSHLGRYLQIDARANLTGKNVLELGPGSDLGTGIYLLSLGAGRYNACDVNSLANAAPDAFYEAMFSRLQHTGGALDVEQLSYELARARAGAPSCLNYVVRPDFDFAEAFGENAIDIVFSQAAFEHFDQIDSTIARITRVCKPGAVLVAEIDLKTHSRWIRDTDPNNIYRYSPAVYKLFWFRGIPNRLRPRDYVQAFERHGWGDVSVLPLHRHAQDLSVLNGSFRDAADQMEFLYIALCARRSDGIQ
jgi:SAM-dependent methyltransferase